ncbi:structure-specific endonuclease subunit SLX4 [Mantella aurantiaca]
MVESDDEFTELCTKLLKRVKKSKPVEGRSVSTASATGKSKLKKPKPSKAKSKTSNGISKGPEQNIKAGDGAEKPSNEDEAGRTVETLLSNGHAEKDCSSRESQEEAGGQQAQPCVKDLVLERMQRYKRASPVRMKLNSNGEEVEAFTMDAGVHTDGDLAMALQMDFKNHSADLEEEGLFFCQLCQRDLTAMSSVLREQHVNRCLDQSEGLQGNSAAPVVPGCPLCGKPFMTEKARASHLKRCAAKLEVPAQTLLLAVQRQAAETGTELPTGVAHGKRKGEPKQKGPSKKRKVAKTGAEMEDLMVAVALSRSLQEETPGCAQPARQIVPSVVCVIEKKRCRKKKDKPPPVLLVQAPEEAVQKLQKRLSMLLSEEPVENNFITLAGSRFWNIQEGDRETWRMQAGKNCVFWDISNMVESRDTDIYYTTELNPPIIPWKAPSKKVQSSQPRAVTPITRNLPAGLPASQAQNYRIASPATPLKDQKDLSESQKDKQVFLDLVELAGEGMTLTQWNAAPSNQTGRESPLSIACSGFIPAEEVTRKDSPVPDTNKNAITTLAADFMEMVNNPHLSDGQLQTDCGEVLHVHMFVLYARCPLLVEAVHSEGFYVDEANTGRVRRFLLNDVSAEAALVFLRFLYSAKTDIPSHCLPHVCELARRFGVQSLIDICELLVGSPHGPEDMAPAEEEEEEEDDNGGEREENFQELLKSMWIDEDEDLFADQEVTEGLEEEEKVNDGRVEEIDLEEIYEFAATQRRMPEEQITEAESSSEHEAEYQDKESEDQSPSTRSQTAGKEQPMDVEIQQSVNCHTERNVNPSFTLSPLQKDAAGSPLKKSPACLHSSSLESSPAVPPLPSPSWTRTQPTPDSPVQSPFQRQSSTAKSPARSLFITPSKPSQSPSAGLSGSSTAVVHTISLISPDRKEDPEADLFPQQSPTPLDDSFDRMFSETCGEYVEPSGLCESRSRMGVDPPRQEPPVLRSSPSVIHRSTLPGLGSSPNIQPQIRYTDTCGEYVEPSGLCESRSRMGVDPPRHEPPVLTSSPSVIQRPTLPELGSSPNIQPQTRSTETCGEYAEPSELCVSRSHMGVDPPRHEPSVLTSSPSVIQRPTLPGLGSSPNIQPPTRSVLGESSYSAPEGGNSPASICKDSKPTQNSSKVSSTNVSQEDDIILISSSDEETEDNAQSAVVKAHSNRSDIITKIKESPASFSIRKDSEGHSLLDKSSSSETSWLVPATPIPHFTGIGVSLLQASHIPQSPKAARAGKHDDSLSDLVSPTQRNDSLTASLNTTKAFSFANQPPIPKTPEKMAGSCASTGSKVSCVRSSPVSSIASSTVFEVVDSEEEEAVAEPQADTSACSFLMDYDEPPIPMEDDLWLNAQESPAKPYTSPEHNASLHKTPAKAPGPSSNTSTPQERDRESEHREGSPSTAASQSKQASFLNSKLWDEWEEEEPELPAFLPLTQRLNKVPDVQKLLRTPVSIVRKRELPPKVAITPLPEYSDMETPVLKKELSRFGVRALPKKQMVLKLKEIFNYTHQVMSSDSEDDVPSSQPRHQNTTSAVQGQSLPASSKHGVPSTAATSKHSDQGTATTSKHSDQGTATTSKHSDQGTATTSKHSDQGTATTSKHSDQGTATTSKHRAQSTATTSKRSDQGTATTSKRRAPATATTSKRRAPATATTSKRRAPATATTSKRSDQGTATTTIASLTQTGKTTTTTRAVQEVDSGDDQPQTASQESTTSSVAASDTSSMSHSSNTNEFETAFADEEEEEPLPASQAASKEALTAEALRRFIEERPDLHKRILLYKPLDLSALHAELKQSGIKMAAGRLLDFLDAHCVTFTTAATRKKSRGRRKAGKRH